jgi:endoribonuclease Dicer
MSSRWRSETDSDHGVEVMELRRYQRTIFEYSLKENLIACVGTGGGKTLISFELIKTLSDDLRKTGEERKWSFFLANTIPLGKFYWHCWPISKSIVIQQKVSFEKHSDLIAREYYGETIDFWSKKDWERELQEVQVLFLTPQIFLNTLRHAILKIDIANLIIFDECHHSEKGHPYNLIMKVFIICSYNKSSGYSGILSHRM